MKRLGPKDLRLNAFVSVALIEMQKWLQKPSGSQHKPLTEEQAEDLIIFLEIGRASG